jgi:hypothetical protein
MTARTAVAAAVGFLAGNLPALAQCPMCRNAAAAQGAAAARALDLGILILLVPAVSMFCGIYWLAVRRRGASDNAS